MFIYLSPFNNANKSFNRNNFVYQIGCVLVGFLKFLKKKRKGELDELDLPPAPPPLEGFEEGLELPELPAFDEKISAPEELPEFNFPEEEKTLDLGKEETEFAFPDIEEKEMPEPIAPIPPIRAPITPQPNAPITPIQPLQEPVAQETEPSFTPPDTYPKIERRLFAQEKGILRERPSLKTIYVRVDKFKATLGSINMVKSDLRKSEEALMKLENIKNSKDRSFDKVKMSLDDLQKKLIFVDKTLFKGD